MRTIIQYIINMIPYMIISIPFYIIIKVLILKKSQHKTNWYHEISLFVFFIYLVGLASQTIIPKIEFGVTGIGIVKGGVHTFNLIPFRAAFDAYTELQHSNLNALIINLLGNILLFVPIGFMTLLLWRISKRKALVIGFSISLFIEICQFFFPRGTDIDDLILNTLGTFVGVILYSLISKIASNKLDKFKTYNN